MPSLIDLRRRVRAVKNTQQITKAMKMVAASKLRRAQERIERAPVRHADAARAAERGARASIRRCIRCSTIARAACRTAGRSSSSSPRDKGLCGSFNTNIIKAARHVHHRECGTARGARPGRPQGPRLLRPPRLRRCCSSRSESFQKLRFEDAQTIAETAIEAFARRRGRPRRCSSTTSSSR